MITKKIYFIFLAILLISSCQQDLLNSSNKDSSANNASGSGTTTGNPVIVMAFNSFSVKSSTGQTQSMNAKACIKRLRFKLLERPTEDNIDFNLGEISIDESGTSLGAHNLPHGTYKRIEIDLDKDCPAGVSISFSNEYGNFSTDESLSLRYEGTFEFDQSEEKLDLLIQVIMTELGKVQNSADIKNILESTSGSF